MSRYALRPRNLLVAWLAAILTIVSGGVGAFPMASASATPATVHGSGRYQASCTNTLTPDVYAATFDVTADAVSPVTTGQNLTITNQHWSVTIPPTLADSLRLLFGASVASQVQVAVDGARVSPGSAKSPLIATNLDLSGAAGTSASGSFDVPDMTLVPTGGGSADFTLSSSLGMTTSLTIGDTPVVLTCLPTSGGPFLSVATIGPSAGRLFHAMAPVRIIDSRPAPSRVGPLGSWTAGSTQTVTVASATSVVPATATAVVANITVTGGTVNNDYLSVWPAGTVRPTVSSLNFGAGQTVANQVTVKLGEGASAGKISIFNAGGAVDVIVDINGYYDPNPGDGYTAVTPARVIDSRPAPSRVGPLASWGAGATQSAALTGGLSGVPADADAVVLNVTATDATAAGDYLTIWPTGATRPTASNLNFGPGRSVPNAVTVALGAGKQISVFNAAGSADVIIDVVGYFRLGSGLAFYPQAPVRTIDSRPAPSRVGPLGPWGSGVTQDVQVVGGLSGVPINADSVVMNVTATGATVANDYLSVWPAGTARPTVSSLNFGVGETVANAVTARVGSGADAGQISVYNAGGTVNVIVDIGGYYA